MKTFTNCATKAKQFFNLLQGYTRGIRITAILILLLMGVSNAWAYDISAGSHIYLVNTDDWSGCQLYIWKSDGYNTSYTFSKITNTNIYHYHFANSWNGYEGVKFRSDTNWSKQSSGNINKSLSSCYFVGKGTTNHTTLANMNGAAKVVSMVSTGGNYTEQANSACIAKVSGYNLAEKASSTTEVNASTGSASNASISAAYGSTITYTATAGTGYTFEGFSTSNSTTLPATKYASGKTATASGYGSTNNTTYYAYFKLDQYTITYNLNGGSGTMTPTTYTVETETFNLPTPTKAGFDFEGWYTTSDFSGSKVTQITKGSTGNITLYAKWTAQAQPDPTHEIYLVGEFNWDAASENMFEQDPNDPNIYTLTKHFDARDRHQTTTQSQPEYEFKLQVDDIKYTVEDNTDANTKDQYKKILQYTRQSKTKILSDGTAYDSDPYYNLLLQADFTGDYVFTYNVSTKELTVEHPTYTQEASYIVGDFSDGATGTDALPIDGGAGHDWTEEHGQSIGTDPNEPICFELGKNSTWEFKIKINGVWYGAENVNITEDGEYILTDDCAYMSERNCTITTTDVDGEYCFSYKVNDDGTITLTVGYPEEDEVEDANTVYLKLNNEWKKDNARYAVYYWNDGGNTWKDMEAIDCNGDYYKAEVPEGYSKLIFVQMDPETTENNWDNKKDYQTPDLTLPTDGKNLCDVEKAKYLYLTPNSNWKEGGARFAAYFFGNGEKWVDMKDDDGDGIYTCEKQSGFPQVIFCRMNPGTTDNKWDNKWNQTGDLSTLNDGKDHFTLTADSWDQGTWAHYSWSTYTAPTYDVTINITGKGSVVIDGTTYTSNSTGTTTQKKTGVEVNTNINVTSIEPADRWAKSAATIIIGNNDQEELSTSHSICGPTTINVTFEQTQCVVHFELQLPTGTVHPAIDDQIVDVNTTAIEPQVINPQGYIFGGWYTEAACTNAYDFSTPVTEDITLYAKWIPYSQCIFFKNNLNWGKVYVYTFKGDVWGNDGKGVYPANRYEYGRMNQIGQSDVFYYALTNTSDGFNYIAFSDVDMHSDAPFDGNNAVYRGDRNDQLQLFIPEKGQSADTRNNTKYYNKGLWMKYNSTESGYDWRGAETENNQEQWSKTYNFTAEKAGGYSFTATVEFTTLTMHYFKVHNLNSDWYGNNGTMTQDNCTDWHFETHLDNAQITPTVSGKYKFTVYLGDGKVMVSLEYPLSTGDYRLAYIDNQTGSFHPGHYIKKRTSGNDTVSFFIHHDQTPQVIVQKCTAISNQGVATWNTINDIEVNPAAALTESGVYNFELQQVENQTNPILLAQATPYTGNYYIRTDAAAGGWEAFRQFSNQMTYSSYADENEPFSYYFCEWVSESDKNIKNVKFTIANDYSYCISDTLAADPADANPRIVTDTEGDLPDAAPNANVRFGWDHKTNQISRAYIAGSGHKKDRFLVLEGNDYLTDPEGNKYTGQTAEGEDRYNLVDNEVVLDDMGNWIYQVEVRANAKTKIKLTALYNDNVQYFKGTESTTVPLLVADTDEENNFVIRLVYDFKTNHLMSAWLAEEGQDGELGADMMVIRKDQEQATQISFTNGESLTNVQTAYAVMTFTNDFVNGDEPEHARAHYWISFPFDVQISSVFGFGEYGDQWILQLYDGASRAEQGYWVDSESYWRYITNKKYVLKKGTGYVLTLNLKKMGSNSGVFEHTDEVSLYFPSTGEIGYIFGPETITTTVDKHTCTIERDNRKIYDSHWNIIGVPGFADISGYNTSTPIINEDAENGGGPSFYYEYLPATNTYQATSTTTTFQTMYGYMVQYHGDLVWKTTAVVKPAELAARRNSESGQPEKVSLRLEIAQNEEMADQTFVQLQQEDATAEFDMNLDLTKIINSGANIYTLAGEQRIQSAGNALPMGEAVVPVGVKIDAEGEYTFRMPDGTEGMVVELIDYERDITTNLLLFDYTVTLPAGSNESRFALHIQPNKSGVTTGVENVGDKAKGIEKYLIDGKLMIRTAEGVIYDAQGHVVQ